MLPFVCIIFLQYEHNKQNVVKTTITSQKSSLKFSKFLVNIKLSCYKISVQLQHNFLQFHGKYVHAATSDESLTTSVTNDHKIKDLFTTIQKETQDLQSVCNIYVSGKNNRRTTTETGTGKPRRTCLFLARIKISTSHILYSIPPV